MAGGPEATVARTLIHELEASLREAPTFATNASCCRKGGNRRVIWCLRSRIFAAEEVARHRTQKPFTDNRTSQALAFRFAEWSNLASIGVT
jgi:hypothetical protein